MEHGDCLLCCLPPQLPGIKFLEKLQALSGPGSHTPCLILVSVAGNGGDIYPGPNLSVRGKKPLAGGDQYLMIHLQKAPCHLGDLLTVLLCGKTCLPDIINLGRVLHAGRNDSDGMKISENTLS